MSDPNKRLEDWNKTIDDARALSGDMKRRALRMRDGSLRRLTLALARFTGGS